MWKSRKRKRLCNLLNWNWNEKLLVGQDYRAEILTLWFSIFKRTIFSWINVYVPRQFDYGLNDSRCEHFLLFIDREIFLINGWQVKHESWSILQIAEHFINSSSIFSSSSPLWNLLKVFQRQVIHTVFLIMRRILSIVHFDKSLSLFWIRPSSSYFGPPSIIPSRELYEAYSSRQA